ncbi:MAG: MotA/TolQ/ExbB proton channel family protein [Deltaproteobacteria bacterium]|nr:MotA/TolQ/ExbB proton channel family protein [Deltaproteobacteria bacterium]
MKTIMLIAVLVFGLLGGIAGMVSPVLAQQAPEAAAPASPGTPEASEDDPEGRTLADWYAMGGWIMHGLVLCSILTLAMVFERLWALRRGAVIPRRFMRKLMEHWRNRDIPQVIAMCGESDVSIARVLRAGLLHFDEGLTRVEGAIEVAGEHEATLLRRNLSVLSALGNIATMMGLLGTVLGMIESFDLIAQTGTGDARVVAGGIFQALVTTAAGLIVGITAVGFHSYLRRKVEILEIDLEDTSFRLMEEISLERESAGEAPAGLTPQEA